jgi:hypothetical protein
MIAKMKLLGVFGHWPDGVLGALGRTDSGGVLNMEHGMFLGISRELLSSWCVDGEGSQSDLLVVQWPHIKGTYILIQKGIFGLLNTRSF